MGDSTPRAWRVHPGMQVARLLAAHPPSMTTDHSRVNPRQWGTIIAVERDSDARALTNNFWWCLVLWSSNPAGYRSPSWWPARALGWVPWDTPPRLNLTEQKQQTGILHT